MRWSGAASVAVDALCPGSLALRELNVLLCATTEKRCFALCFGALDALLCRGFLDTRAAACRGPRSGTSCTTRIGRSLRSVGPRSVGLAAVWSQRPGRCPELRGSVLRRCPERVAVLAAAGRAGTRCALALCPGSLGGREARCCNGLQQRQGLSTGLASSVSSSKTRDARDAQRCSGCVLGGHWSSQLSVGGGFRAVVVSWAFVVFGHSWCSEQCVRTQRSNLDRLGQLGATVFEMLFLRWLLRNISLNPSTHKKQRHPGPAQTPRPGHARHCSKHGSTCVRRHVRGTGMGELAHHRL